MNTAQLHYFIALAKELNFTNVAKTFYLTQPTICRQISALEEELGVQLVNRSTHGLTLTAAGSEFQRYAAEALNILDTASSYVKHISANSVKKLRLAIFSSSEDILMRCVEGFSDQHPDIQILVDTFSGEAMTEALNNPEYSFYFLHTRYLENHPEFQHLHVKREKSFLVLRPTDLDKVQESDYSALSSCPFVCTSCTGGWVLYELFNQVCSALNITPNIVNFYSRASSALLGVKMGIGNTILPASLVKGAENVGLIPIQDEIGSLDSCIAWRNHVHSPEIDSFYAHVCQLFASDV